MTKGNKKSKSHWEKYEGNYIIPIMGPTGAGKSFLINSLLGKEEVEVGHRLHSCTVELQPVEIPNDMVEKHLPFWPPGLSGRAKLIIVDTPGFDDTRADDSATLKRIADWLAESYGAGAKLAGVIYLQDITQPRVTGATSRNFDVFDKLCGSNACKSVILGTTKWQKIHKDDISMAESREQELQETFWNGMISRGSTMHRVIMDEKKTEKTNPLSDTLPVAPLPDSLPSIPPPPWDLVQAVILKGESASLMIQRELMDMDKSLPQTEAAFVLRKRIEELIRSMESAGLSREHIRAFKRDVEALKEKSIFARIFGRLFGSHST